MKISHALLLAGLGAAALAPGLRAQIAELGFRAHTGSDFVDQFPGLSGDGWLSPWINSRHAPVHATIGKAPPGLTPEYALRVKCEGNQSGAGSSVSRRYDLSLLPARYTITCRFRLESELAAWDGFNDYVKITDLHPGGADTTPANHTFLIGAYGAATGALPARNWAFYDGDSTKPAYDPARQVDTGIPLEVGLVYTFTITVDQSTRTYSAAMVSSAGRSFSKDKLGWRSNVPGGSALAFVGRRDQATDAPVVFMIDDIRIGAAP